MASAKKTTVKETKTTVVDVERVVLELSTEEARELLKVLGTASGAYAAYSALYRAGL